MLYRMIELPSNEPVQYVGCYVLRWRKAMHPTHGFQPVEEDTLVEFANLCRRYPNEAVPTLLEMALDSEPTIEFPPSIEEKPGEAAIYRRLARRIATEGL